MDHIESFKMLMLLQMTSDEVMCRAFPITLKGAARVWFSKIPQEPSQTLNNSSRVLFIISLGGKGIKSQLAIFPTFSKPKENH